MLSQTEPRVCICCMIRAPLKKINQSLSTLAFFFSLILLSYVLQFLIVFPGTYYGLLKISFIFSDAGTVVVLLHLYAICPHSYFLSALLDERAWLPSQELENRLSG